ncbi:ABC transporter substrate-binding protein [Oenococcus alcoholitolerans]|uniref:ABC transporter substrate-binding protein n=1 Tax=Oenococcus alcoholitolerans TaxID=931074 RepID=UPI003F6EF638
MIKNKKIFIWLIVILVIMLAAWSFFSKSESPKRKINIELFEFKPEAGGTFRQLVDRFEKQNPNIHVELSAPGDAYTVLKTRMVKGKAPDLIGLGGEQYYVDYAKSNIFADLSNDSLIKKFSPSYIKSMQYLQNDNKIYGVPYVANVSGVLYNKQLFAKDHLQIPKTWDQLIALSKSLKSQGKTPFYMGYKDDWTIQSSFGPLAANLMNPKAFVISNNNIGKYDKQYNLPLERMKELSKYSQGDVFSYNYNDATSAFAQGKSYMYLQGNWAISAIKQANPKIQLGMFPFPAANDRPSRSVSGVDLVFSISKQTHHYAATKKLLEFLISKNAYSTYLKEQYAVPTLRNNNSFPSDLADVKNNLKRGYIVMAPQYMYPTELDVNSLLQSYLVNKSRPRSFVHQLDSGLKIILGPQGGND